MQYLAFFETKNVKSNRVSIGNENNNNFHRDYSFNVPGSQQWKTCLRRKARGKTNTIIRTSATDLNLSRKDENIIQRTIAINSLHQKSPNCVCRREKESSSPREVASKTLLNYGTICSPNFENISPNCNFRARRLDQLHQV